MLTHNEIGNQIVPVATLATTRFVTAQGANCIKQQLIRAIYAKGMAAFDTLIEALHEQHGSIDVKIGSGRGKWTPLMFAVHKRRNEMVHKLLELGADPNCFDHSTKKTALHSACTNGYNRIVRMLLATQKVRDINLADNDEGESALFAAVKRGRLLCVALLLQHSLHGQICDINMQMRSTGQSPLFVACDKGDLAMVQLLLNYQHTACDLNAPGKKGYTPLMKAVSKGHSDVVRLLLNCDPQRENPLGMPNLALENGDLKQCAAKLAVRVHKFEIMRMLLDVEGNHRALYTKDYKERDILEYSTHVKKDRRIREDIKRRLLGELNQILRQELPYLPNLVLLCITDHTY